MTVRPHDHVERDLNHDGRLDLAVAPEAGDRVLLEPASHLRDLGIAESGVGLADRYQPPACVVANGEGVVGEDTVALAVADLDADDDAVDRRQGLFHLQPAEPTATGGVEALRVLDHEALVAPGAGRREELVESLRRVRRFQAREGKRAAIFRKSQAE